MHEINIGTLKSPSEINRHKECHDNRREIYVYTCRYWKMARRKHTEHSHPGHPEEATD